MVAKPPASSISNLLLPAIISLIISTFPAIIHTQKDNSYNECSPFKCVNLSFSFPFSSSRTSGHCGVPDYQISCDPSTNTSNLLLSGRLYRVKDFYLSENDRLITVVDSQLVKDLSSGSCDSLHNLSVANTSIGSLALPPGSSNCTFFKCPNELSLSKEFTDKVVINLSCNDGHDIFLRRDRDQFGKPLFDPVVAPSGCVSVLVPASRASSLFLNQSAGDPRLKLLAALNEGFPLEWPKLDECERCQNRGGHCGYEGGSKKILCFCKGHCVKHRKSKLPLIIGVATGSCSVVVIAILLIVFRKRIRTFSQKSYSGKDGKSGGLNVEQFIKTYRSTLLSNYSHNDVKKMTNGFKEKLGSGGYGNVYKGKFPDGRLVAVKMLEKTSNHSNNFINEVATIGRIHHVNVIHLLGFCCDGSTRALIYEYMPNGSLADLLSKENTDHSLKLERLLEIALGIAHAIEYLHYGCELRILHLDIKPENVLLDQDFNPKISDFGLARVHSRNKSVVTVTGARGTIGYIAPEIFLRNLGNPSHKSDVYSYGMLLLEMVGEREHIKTSKSSSNVTEAYFPDWIYDKITQEEVHLKHTTDFQEQEEDSVARKIVMVGLWCIQINPRDRPSMTRVVELLSGGVEAIEMPPKPSFLSPPRLQIENEINSIDSNTSDLPLTYVSHETDYRT